MMNPQLQIRMPNGEVLVLADDIRKLDTDVRVRDIYIIANNIREQKLKEAQDKLNHAFDWIPDYLKEIENASR